MKECGTNKIVKEKTFTSFERDHKVVTTGMMVKIMRICSSNIIKRYNYLKILFLRVP